MNYTRKHVFVAGKVQGVGFRWSARLRAHELDLTGWVRNLPDRRVELCFQGEQGAVNEMEDWCRAGAPRSRVTDVSVSEVMPVEGETGFEII
jgi:acylphosphatase